MGAHLGVCEDGSVKPHTRGGEGGRKGGRVEGPRPAPPSPPPARVAPAGPALAVHHSQLWARKWQEGGRISSSGELIAEGKAIMAPLRGTLGRGRPGDRDPLGATRWAAAPSQVLPEGGRGTPQSPARKWGQRMLPTPRRPGPGATAPAPSTQPWTRALTSEPAGGRGGRLSHTDPGSEDRGLPTWATHVPCTQPPGRPLLPGWRLSPPLPPSHSTGAERKVEPFAKYAKKEGRVCLSGKCGREGARFLSWPNWAQRLRGCLACRACGGAEKPPSQQEL